MRIPENILAGVALDANIIANYVAMSTIESSSATAKITAGSAVESIGYKIYRAGYSASTGTIDSYTVDGSSRIYTFTKTGLTSGTQYFIEITPYGSTGGSGDYGDTVMINFTTTKPATAATIQSFRAAESVMPKTGVTSSTTDSSVTASTASSSSTTNDVRKNISLETESLFQISNPNKGRQKFITAEREFTSLSTSETYFAFGTQVYMKATVDSILNSGGIMIFSDNFGQTGYYLSIQSSDSADKYDQNPFRILKISGGSQKYIDDSQTLSGGKYGAIFNGEAYKIDLLVKKTSTQVEITVYINGFKIKAVDIASASNEILNVTNKVSLVSSEGTLYFDYVYAMNANESTYNNKVIFSSLGGKFSKALLDSSFGEKVLQIGTEESSKAELDEFGPAARELRYYKVRYSKSPAQPRYATTGGNGLVSILGQRLNAFGAELYVLNNSSMYVSLSDSDINNLWVVGKNISRTGDVEYIDDSAGKFSTPEPVIFDSSWIQKQSDAEALANWIKSSWANKQQIVTMSVTGNPLLSVGDIVTIKHSYLGLSGTQKFIVTSVNQSYAEGIDTTISCRTL